VTGGQTLNLDVFTQTTQTKSFGKSFNYQRRGVSLDEALKKRCCTWQTAKTGGLQTGDIMED
jgi:hypothetical protein